MVDEYEIRPVIHRAVARYSEPMLHRGSVSRQTCSTQTKSRGDSR
jgi:hypothetical protein